MSLLGNLANEEITNFLRTATIKNAYFAKRSKLLEVRPSVQGSIPENELPYYKHVAGEYILRNPVTVSVVNPKTGVSVKQTYKNTSTIYNRLGEQIVEVENTSLYNSTVFDEMMYVTSLDSGTEIPFTLENLHSEYATVDGGVHSKTLEAYKIPGRYYELLCAKYPDQVDLIKAIIYPVKGTRAITAAEYSAYNISATPLPTTSQLRREFIMNADDYTLLQCDENLLEENERFDMLSYAKQTLAMIDRKWNVKEFYDEQNYPVVLWSMMWCLLRLALIQRRYSNIKTPFVHSSHVWDYLVSKGMESYKSYLTTKQTQFLYKNINYIIRNRGKQKATNILVDEFLSEAGLNLKTKTIVLDTTETLNTANMLKPESIKTQCSKCARCGYCHKNISTYQCPDFLNIGSLCTAEPVVLTEEFVGARKSKIIESLVNQYGYSEEAATTKYERSLIWEDAQVEEIKENYNRDQLTDVNCSTETLDNLISREHNADLEPVYNDLIVAQQSKDLAHIAGTVAPTKVLEIIKQKPQTKYANLFNKYVTETMWHFAPTVIRTGAEVRDNKGTVLTKTKTNCSFDISFDDVADVYTVNFGELLALTYLGVTKEHLIELIYDHINTDTEYKSGCTYFRLGDNADLDDLEVLTNANMVQLLTETTESEYIAEMNEDPVQIVNKYYPGMAVPSGVYRWMPNSVSSKSKRMPMIDGHEFLTNFTKQWAYDFPIPNKAHINNTWKFGKPVPQQQLIDAWYADKGENLDAIIYIPFALEQYYDVNGYEYKALYLNGCMYIVSTTKPEKGSMWENMDIALTIDGEVKHGAFFYNNGEIAIIPKYFQWYHKHCSVTDEKPASVTHSVDIVPDDAAWWTLDGAITSTPEIRNQTVGYHFYHNAELNEPAEAVINLEVEKYFDMDSFLDKYVDIIENVTDISDLGAYMTTMYQLLEDVYTSADCTTSIKKQLAAKFVLQHCLVHNDEYEVDLTGMSKTADWPFKDTTKYPINKNPVKVALYSSWLRKNKSLKLIIDAADTHDRTAEIWKKFNVNCLDKLINTCTLPYVTSLHEEETIEKLKQLVLHFSSYRITLLDVAADDNTFDDLSPVVNDSSDESISYTSYEYMNPIMDSLDPVHVGCFETDDNEFFFRTEDVTAQADKEYYCPVVTSTSDLHYEEQLNPDAEDDEEKLIELVDYFNSDSVEYAENKLDVGTDLEDYKFFERVDLRKLLGITDRQIRVQIKYDNNKWYYRTGSDMSTTRTIPATAVDKNKTESLDAFLFARDLTKDQKTKFATYKRRKNISVYDVNWGDWMSNDSLTYYMNRARCGRIINTIETVTLNTISDNSTFTFHTT